MALAAKAGEKLQESEFEFPAATTTVTPLLVAASITEVYPESAPWPPKLMLSTAGRRPEVVTQSMAEYCQDRAPEPESLRVFTA